jgi:hypothetical protein
VCKPEMGGGLARYPCHNALFGFFDHTGFSCYGLPLKVKVVSKHYKCSLTSTTFVVSL